MKPHDLRYALDKQVPDLSERGCTIATAYGDITVPAGWMAQKLAAHMTRMLQDELGRQVRQDEWQALCQGAGHVL